MAPFNLFRLLPDLLWKWDCEEFCFHTNLVQVNGATWFNKIHVNLKGRCSICIDLNRSQIRQAFDELVQKQNEHY